MGIRQFKPVSKASRFRSVSDFAEITRTTGEKSLMEPLKKSGGRDNHGHISMRRIGGGCGQHGDPAFAQMRDNLPRRFAHTLLAEAPPQRDGAEFTRHAYFLDSSGNPLLACSPQRAGSTLAQLGLWRATDLETSWTSARRLCCESSSINSFAMASPSGRERCRESPASI